MKTAVKPHALKEKKGVWNQAASFVGLPVQAAGELARRTGQVRGGGRELVRAVEEENGPLGHRPALQ